jgi:hypothetical protein
MNQSTSDNKTWPDEGIRMALASERDKENEHKEFN